MMGFRSRVWMIGMVITLVGSAHCPYANDGSMTGWGGRVRPLSGEHRSIQMVKEWVLIDLYANDFQVAVEYRFCNTGHATTVTMGFPDRGFGQGGAQVLAGKKSAYRQFRSWVDGQPVTTTFQLTAESQTDDHYSGYWVKHVHFARGQTRAIRIEYRAKPGWDPGPEPDKQVWYDFTGGNWKGTVAESHLLVVLHAPGNYWLSVPVPMRQQGNRLSYRWVNWEAQESFKLCYVEQSHGKLNLHGNTPVLIHNVK